MAGIQDIPALQDMALCSSAPLQCMTNRQCPPPPKAANKPSGCTWEHAIPVKNEPPSLRLSRTFSNYNIPSYQLTIDYILWGGEMPSLPDLCDGIPEMCAQMENGGYLFTDEQQTRWKSVLKLIYK